MAPGRCSLFEPARALRVDQGDLACLEAFEKLGPVDLAGHQWALAPNSAVSSSTV
jgi:hypothetical protein